MKILMLVNWKVKKCSTKPNDLQPPDYYINNEKYWFYKHFENSVEVDIIDTSSFDALEKLEKNKLRFYIWQSIKAIPRMHNYDLIVSHGMQSGLVIAFFRRFFKTRCKHIVFDIGSFASASESGVALKLMQFSSKSIDKILYHTSSQIKYYKQFFPWVVNKSVFLKFGTDLEFFDFNKLKDKPKKDYIICVGYAKRDWDTLVRAYSESNIKLKLKLVGHIDEKYYKIDGVEQIDFIPINELINEIYNSKFSVLPLESFNYSYGQMTLMQQMALGKCVVAARVPSLIDYVINNETAIFYSPGDVEDLKSKLCDLVGRSSYVDKVGKRARKYLEKECNEQIMAKEIERIFLEVINGK